MTHYAAASPWWTLLAVANPDACSASVRLEAFSDIGDLAGVADKEIPAKGSLWEEVRTLFGAGG